MCNPFPSVFSYGPRSVWFVLGAHTLTHILTTSSTTTNNTQQTAAQYEHTQHTAQCIAAATHPPKAASLLCSALLCAPKSTASGCFPTYQVFEFAQPGTKLGHIIFPYDPEFGLYTIQIWRDFWYFFCASYNFVPVVWERDPTRARLGPPETERLLG